MYKIFCTARFDKEFFKQLSQEEQKEVENFEKKQLTDNPYVGDPLGYKFFREKKVGGKRVYYLVYDDLEAVLMVAISGKKTQQETIDEVKENLEEYYEATKETVRQLS